MQLTPDEANRDVDRLVNDAKARGKYMIAVFTIDQIQDEQLLNTSFTTCNFPRGDNDSMFHQCVGALAMKLAQVHGPPPAVQMKRAEVMPAKPDLFGQETQKLSSSAVPEVQMFGREAVVMQPAESDN